MFILPSWWRIYDPSTEFAQDVITERCVGRPVFYTAKRRDICTKSKTTAQTWKGGGKGGGPENQIKSEKDKIIRKLRAVKTVPEIENEKTMHPELLFSLHA